MIPGVLLVAEGPPTSNAGACAIPIVVGNTGDRPVPVGRHTYFAQIHPALEFDCTSADCRRPDIAAGTAVWFEAGQRREVQLIPIGAARRVFGLIADVMGPLVRAAGVLLALLLAQGAHAQTAADCIAPQQQQLMNACAEREYREVDAALNAAWQPAKSFADRIGKGDALLAAQRAWLVYRDAACAVQASPYEGGSIRPLIHAKCLTRLTAERTKMLLEFHAY